MPSNQQLNISALLQTIHDLGIREVNESQPAHDRTFCNLSSLFFLQGNHMKSEKPIYVVSSIPGFDRVDTFKTDSALPLTKQGGSSCICDCTMRLCDLGICGTSTSWIIIPCAVCVAPAPKMYNLVTFC